MVSEALRMRVILVCCLLVEFFRLGLGIRFGIDKEECLSHSVRYKGETMHISFVVIKAESSWDFAEEGVDLIIKGPGGEHIHDFRNKISEKYEFIAQRKGIYQFCFINKSPYHEIVDFDVHVGHNLYRNQCAKDEHFKPMLEMISKLEEALHNVQFEQHWLEAQTDRQVLVNKAMGKRALYKVVLESLALVGASFLQVYLLQRLFEQKLGTSRV